MAGSSRAQGAGREWPARQRTQNSQPLHRAGAGESASLQGRSVRDTQDRSWVFCQQ